MDGRKIAGLQKSFFHCLRKYEEIYKNVIDEYAIVESLITRNFQPAIVSNDYFYFCVARACKTAIAINILLKERLPEDAIILSRSIYESYLHMVFAVRNYERIDELVAYKVGLHRGIYKHPQTLKGKVDYRKVVINEDKPPERIGLNPIELANQTGHEADSLLHPLIYSYLSEFSHPHFMASGNYRAEKGMPQYCYDGAQNMLQASFLATYVNTLVLSCILSYENIDEENISFYRNSIVKGANVLLSYIRLLEFPEKYKKVPQYIKNRLKSVLLSVKEN